ncbi:hypothetical protein WD019_09715 [Fictibacillus sp. Mic-4]
MNEKPIIDGSIVLERFTVFQLAPYELELISSGIVYGVKSLPEEVTRR